MSSSVSGFSFISSRWSDYLDLTVLNNSLPTSIKNYIIKPLNLVVSIPFSVAATIESIGRLIAALSLAPAFQTTWYKREFSLFNPHSALFDSVNTIPTPFFLLIAFFEPSKSQ